MEYEMKQRKLYFSSQEYSVRNMFAKYKQMLINNLMILEKTAVDILTFVFGVLIYF